MTRLWQRDPMLCDYCKEQIIGKQAHYMVMKAFQGAKGAYTDHSAFHEECFDRLLASISRGDGVVTKVNKLEYPLE